MYFVFICKDRPDAGDIRAQNRQKHLDYLGRFAELIIAAGPLQTDDGAAMTGSLLILDLPDRQAAEDFAAGDPYAQAGVFESVEIRRWKKVFPAEI